MMDLGGNPFDKKGNIKLDNERKAKVLKIAHAMKNSCYELSVAFQDEQWLVVCTARVYGVVYQSANTIDTFSVADHADLFRMAFSDALKEQEIAREKKMIIMPAGHA